MMVQAQFLPEDVFEIKGRGLVMTGKLISGVIKIGMATRILSNEVQIEAIEGFRKNWEVVDAAKDGQKDLGLLLVNTERDAVKNLIAQKMPLVFEGQE